MTGEPSVLRQDPQNASDGGSLQDGDPAESHSDSSDADSIDAVDSNSSKPHRPRASRGQAKVVHVAGFWQRSAGAAIDLAVILPIAVLMSWLVGAISGLSLPSSRHHGLDFWLDVVLTHDPAIIAALTTATAVACVYLLVFQGLLGQTLGMRATKTRIIDIYGDPPSMPTAAFRTLGYLACVASLGLGYLWVAIDAEKRGLHDWISRTYVVRI